MISIIIPTYNAAKYLDACFQSCLSQTHNDFEIIAVNDGSTDNSLEILERYAQKDFRITVISKENGGLPRARETGLAKAKGEYVFFLDSDDTITPNALDVLWKQAQISDSDIIIGQMISVLESGKIIADHKNRFAYTDAEHLLLCSFLAKSIVPSLCGRLIKKRLFEKIAFPYQYFIGEDVIINLEIILKHSPTVFLVDSKVYNYIQRPNSMVNTNTTATADKRMNYMIWVYEYLKTIEHTNELDNCTAKFFIEEYFSFLRDGGTDCPTELKKLICEKYLKNKWAVSQIAPWRLALVRAYNINPALGKVARQILIGARKTIR
ncbi:MAG: glycosyltransferase [Bacteroidales bacterium]|nr:glycosyltransferase [Bacteroidales bacterium]